MGKTYYRVDDRLIHGQIVTAWSQTLGIKEIIAIDEMLVGNPTLQMITLMAVPKQFGPKVVTAAQAKELLSKDVDHNRLVITRQCRNLAPLMDEVLKGENLNLGNVSKQEGTTHTLSAPGGCTLSLTDEDYNTMQALAERGAHIMSCRMPTEKAKTWEEMTHQK